MANYTPRQNSGLDALVGSEQTAPRTKQFYDQVIATQRQIADKDYQSIISGLSKYDFQGTLGGVKTYVKRELNHLSFDDLAELSVSLKEQYQTQKNTSGVDNSARREYRSAIATVNYYRNRKKKENKYQKLATAEREGTLSYQSNGNTVLASEFIKDEVYTEDIVKKKSSYEDALETVLRMNGVEKSKPQKEPVELDTFDLLAMEEAAPEYSGLSYHLRESRTDKRDGDEVLAADIVPEVRDSEEVINEGRKNLRNAAYEEELEKAFLSRWDTDIFFQ